MKKICKNATKTLTKGKVYDITPLTMIYSMGWIYTENNAKFETCKVVSLVNDNGQKVRVSSSRFKSVGFRIDKKIKDFIYSLHKFNKLDDRIVQQISVNFEIDAKEFCAENGITYNIVENKCNCQHYGYYAKEFCTTCHNKKVFPKEGDTKPCVCCKKQILIEDFYNYGCPHCGESSQD